MKVRHSLYTKFIFAYFIFAALSIATVLIVVRPLTQNSMVKYKASTLFKEASIISSRYADNFYNESVSTSEISSQLSSLSSFTSVSVWIIDSNGVILYSTGNDLPSSGTLSAFDPSDFGSSYYTVGHFYNEIAEDTLSVIAPITYNFTVMGYVIIHTPISEIVYFRNQMLLITVLTVGIIFLLSSIILIVFTRAVYLPMRKITRATEEYAGGNFKYPLNIETDDEIGRLSASLNYMAGELSDFEDNQKKFIANVSHDFRSPLTSIKGYIEAMLDGTVPEELHEKYLSITLKETERLTKLTNSLLTLNNLNIKGANLDITDFDINKIIKDTVASFEGICTNKRISCELVLSGENLLVSADMGKIQQVLYNLIDNAIKFSHHDSSIRIETTEKRDTVFVSVKDFGIGIPKDNIKHIFDRFYKTDLSRGKDKKGTGLGLSITKEIINAHHENINVISTEGVGTEFIFTLPRSKENAEDDDII